MELLQGEQCINIYKVIILVKLFRIKVSLILLFHYSVFCVFWSPTSWSSVAFAEVVHNHIVLYIRDHGGLGFLAQQYHPKTASHFLCNSFTVLVRHSQIISQYGAPLAQCEHKMTHTTDDFCSILLSTTSAL